MRETTRAVSCGTTKGADRNQKSEVQKTGMLDLAGAVKYVPSHYEVCKGVRPCQPCGAEGVPLHSLREQIRSSHDQFKRTLKMSTIQGQMGTLLHN